MILRAQAEVFGVRSAGLVLLVGLLLAACGGGTNHPPAEECVLPTGAPQVHSGTLAQDETWSPDALHQVQGVLQVTGGATLTLPACSVVLLDPGAGIEVADGSPGQPSRLVSQGTANLPVLLVPAQDGQPWSSVWVDVGGFLDLNNTALQGGGGGAAREGASLVLWADSNQSAAQPMARLNQVLVMDSVGLGVLVERYATFDPSSDGLFVSGSGSYPVQLDAQALSELPAGTYTGNAADLIVLARASANQAVQVDTTIHDRGVPYQVGSSITEATLEVDGSRLGTAPLLTLEPGVELRFGPAGRLVVGYDPVALAPAAALRAEGTADQPIVLTSAGAAPAAGDWVGIYFEGSSDHPLDGRNRLSNLAVAYAGGPSQTNSYSCPNPAKDPSRDNDAAIIVLGQPQGVFLESSLILESAGDGIERGWIGEPLDFLAGNDFQNVAACRQSYPRPSVGQCPDPSPCP
jgi:hypothetical protein